MITTSRLRLRNFVESDRPDFRTLLADPATMQPWGGPYDGERADCEFDDYLSHAQRYGFAPFAVLLNDKLVGDMGFQHLEDGPELEIVYRLLPATWGKGYATEAGDAALSYAFGDLKQQTIVAVIAEDNGPSRALASRLGFVAGDVGTYYGLHLLRHEVTADQHDASVVRRAG